MAGAYFDPSDPAHVVIHWWGKISGWKAWEGKVWDATMGGPRLGMNLHYLSRIDPAPEGAAETAAGCLPAMRRLRRSAELNPQAAKIHHHMPSFPLF